LLGEQLSTVVRTLHVEGVKLPGNEIEIPELTIRRPLKFLGSPGTNLIVTTGSINIRKNTTFKECTIILKIPAQANIPSRSLFRVHPGAKLELQDCHVKAEYTIGHPNYVSASENKIIISDDNCINMLSEYEKDPENMAESLSENKEIPVISLMSSSFMNFYNHIIVSKDSNANIEKCGFFRSKGAAFNCTNPRNLKIEGTQFEDCNDSGIEIKFLKDESKEIFKRTIKIEGNTINESKGSGILIYGEKSVNMPLKADIYLRENKIQSCKEDGILIRNMELDYIEISNNMVICSASNGIGIYNTLCTNLDLNQITSKDNGFCGVYIQETACNIKNSLFTNNGVSGVGVVGDPISLKGKNTNNEINIIDSNTSGNRQNGISLLDYYKGIVSIVSCKISDNKDYGIFLSTHEIQDKTQQNQSSSVATSASIINPMPKSKVIITKGEIKHNKKGGIYLSQQYTHIDSTLIDNNGEFAIYIPSRNGEKDLAFSASTLMNECIQGHIGGRWGKISIYQNSTVCGCAVCSIF